MICFFLLKKHTETLIEQTKTKPQETLEVMLNKQIETFAFNPPINFSEEGKWFIALTSFEATNSVFNINDETIAFQSLHPVIGFQMEAKTLLIN